MAKPRQIHKLGDIGYVRMCAIGPSGSGKTVFFGSAPKALFLTTDPEGTYSAKVQGSDAEEWICKTAKDLTEAYVYLRDEGHKEYDIVVIDNVSEAQKLHLYDAKAKALAKPNSRADPLVPEPGDYLRAQIATVKMVKQFHDLPMHVAWTGHQKGWEDEFGEPYYSLVLQGGKGEIAQTIMGYMNINVFIEVIEQGGKEVRRFWSSYHGPFRGKDRFHAMGKYQDDLTWPRLMELIAASRARVEKRDRTTSTTSKTRTTSTNKAAPVKRRRAMI